jgi:hypothetical protein
MPERPPFANGTASATRAALALFKGDKRKTKSPAGTPGGSLVSLNDAQYG